MLDTNILSGVGLVFGVVSLGLGIRAKNRKGMILGSCAILLWVAYVMIDVIGV